MLGLATHLLGDREEALDVSQEVFLRVFRTLHRFRGQSALRTWIFRIVVNQVRNLPEGSHWQVIGIGLNQWPLLAAGIALGGNVRVGLEDNFYLEEGHMARSNAELVMKAVLMCRQEGREPASAAETRRLLGLPPEPRRVGAA